MCDHKSPVHIIYGLPQRKFRESWETNVDISERPSHLFVLQAFQRAERREDREPGENIHACVLQRLRRRLRELHVRGHEQDGDHQRQHNPIW